MPWTWLRAASRACSAVGDWAVGIERGDESCHRFECYAGGVERVRKAAKRRATIVVTLALVVLAAITGVAQRRFGGFGGRWVPFEIEPNVPYDGRFTFVRVKYQTAPGGYWWRGLPSWAHGYPL